MLIVEFSVEMETACEEWERDLFLHPHSSISRTIASFHSPPKEVGLGFVLCFWMLGIELTATHRLPTYTITKPYLQSC